MKTRINAESWDRYFDLLGIFCQVAQIHPDSVSSAEDLKFWIQNLQDHEAREVVYRCGWGNILDGDCPLDPAELDPCDVLMDMFDGSRIEAGLPGFDFEKDPW